MAGDLIRPADLVTERTSPVASEFMVVDNGVTVAKSKISDIGNTARPFSNQAEAEAGISTTKTMTPLATKQAVTARIDVDIASKAQGDKADSAVQPARTITAGTGLTGGGDLSADRSVALSAGSQASLALADTAVQPARSISAGTGLTGGGSLAADRTISLSSGSQTSLAKADSAVQPDDIVDRFATAAEGYNLNIGRDKLNYSVVANLIRLTGDAAYNLLYGINREIQYMAADEVNRYWYTTHDNDQVPNLAIITRYPFDGTGVNRTQSAVSLPSDEFGHQGLAVEASGKLWSTDGTHKLAAIRFDFVDGMGPQNKQQYILFEDQGNISGSWNNDVSCFDNLSDKWIIGHAKIVGEETVVFRLWDKAELIAGGPGNYSNAWKKQIYARGLYASSTFPVQGSTSPDDKVLVACSGGNGFAVDPRRMYRYDIDTGEVLEADKNVMVGAIEAATDGTGISYELEGMTTITVDNVRRVCVGVRSGSSLTPSVFRVLMLGVNDRTSVNIQASGQAAVYSRLGTPIGGVEINTTAMKAMAYGAGVNYRIGTAGVDKWEAADTNGSWRPMSADTQDLGGGVSRRIKAVWAQIFQMGTFLFLKYGTGDPTGVEATNNGSVFIRTDGGPGTTIYANESGNTSTTTPVTSAWRGVQCIRASSTAGRPSSAPQGYMMFDTTLAKPIWQSSATPTSPVWKDAAGTTV